LVQASSSIYLGLRTIGLTSGALKLDSKNRAVLARIMLTEPQLRIHL
jgi:hypothetical protein